MCTFKSSIKSQAHVLKVANHSLCRRHGSLQESSTSVLVEVVARIDPRINCVSYAQVPTVKHLRWLMTSSWKKYKAAWKRHVSHSCRVLILEERKKLTLRERTLVQGCTKDEILIVKICCLETCHAVKASDIVVCPVSILAMKIWSCNRWQFRQRQENRQNHPHVSHYSFLYCLLHVRLDFGFPDRSINLGKSIDNGCWKSGRSSVGCFEIYESSTRQFAYWSRTASILASLRMPSDALYIYSNKSVLTWT